MTDTLKDNGLTGDIGFVRLYFIRPATQSEKRSQLYPIPFVGMPCLSAVNHVISWLCNARTGQAYAKGTLLPCKHAWQVAEITAWLAEPCCSVE